MNLLLLRNEDFEDARTVRLAGRRLVHAREVLRTQVGDTLRVGRLGGQVGTGKVTSQTEQELVLEVALDEAPPARANADLLLAIPRPKALKRVLSAVASLGVDKVVLVNSARVEKSYFDSKVLEPAFVEDLMCLGLEQASDTRLPEVVVRERFRPFVEDELDLHFGPDNQRYAPHPGSPTRLEELSPKGRLLLALGPDGGWVPFEVELLEQRGFLPVSLGPRTLRGEVAVPYALGALISRRST